MELKTSAASFARGNHHRLLLLKRHFDLPHVSRLNKPSGSM